MVKCISKVTHPSTVVMIEWLTCCPGHCCFKLNYQLNHGSDSVVNDDFGGGCSSHYNIALAKSLSSMLLLHNFFICSISSQHYGGYRIWAHLFQAYDCHRSGPIRSPKSSFHLTFFYYNSMKWRPSMRPDQIYGCRIDKTALIIVQIHPS